MAFQQRGAPRSLPQMTPRQNRYPTRTQVRQPPLSRALGLCRRPAPSRGVGSVSLGAGGRACYASTFRIRVVSRGCTSSCLSGAHSPRCGCRQPRPRRRLRFWAGDSRSSNFGLRQEGFPAIESNVQSKAGSRSGAWSPEPEASGKIARVGHAWPHEPPSMSAELCCVAGCPGPSVHLQTEEMKPPPQWSRRPRGLRARGEGVTVGVTVVASQPGGPTSRSSHPPSCIRVDLCDQWNKTSHIQL